MQAGDFSNREHAHAFAYAFREVPDREVIDIISEIPPRWARMPPLSRAVLVEVGRALAVGGLPSTRRGWQEYGRKAGLIGATRTGSLSTDLDFAATLAAGPALASPALFGYTLPTIPLAEAAGHFGLTGPVLAFFVPDAPLGTAVEEAERWLAGLPDLALMLACAFDSYGNTDRTARLDVNVQIVS